MRKIKTYEDFTNEEINWKGLAAGAMSFLATACSNVEIRDKSGNMVNGDYESSGIVKSKEENVGSVEPPMWDYEYTVVDNNGNEVTVYLEDDIISVGDSVTVSVENGEGKLIMKEEDCKDPSKCFPLPHHHIKGSNRQNPENY